MNEEFTNLRASAIPDRHRGGLLTSWQGYAEYLEQLLADTQHGVDRVLQSKVVESKDLTSDEYRRLPRARQRIAKRGRRR